MGEDIKDMRFMTWNAAPHCITVMLANDLMTEKERQALLVVLNGDFIRNHLSGALHWELKQRAGRPDGTQG